MTKEQIKACIKYGNGNITSLADLLGYSRQNLTNKINRETLTDEELKTIAKSLGAEYISLFRFKDGKEI